MRAAPRQLPAHTHTCIKQRFEALHAPPAVPFSTVFPVYFQRIPNSVCKLYQCKSELQKHEIKLILCINQPLFINMMLTAFAALRSYRHTQCSLQASSLPKRLRFCTRICPKVWVSERKTINFFLHLTVLLMFTINVCSS